MHVFRHDHCDVQFDPFAMFVDAVFQYQVASFGQEGLASQFVECRKDRCVGFLYMRQSSSITIWIGDNHGCVARTLLSACALEERTNLARVCDE